MTEPVPWVQTNLREVDASDAKRLVIQLADMRANIVLMGMAALPRTIRRKCPITTPVRTFQRVTTCSETLYEKLLREAFVWKAGTTSAIPQRLHTMPIPSGCFGRRTVSRLSIKVYST
jgi:hypothetical protein